MGKSDIMSPRKLSEDDRLEILNLYRTTEETTSTLAVRFGVSSSTVSRFLKNSLSDQEYEDLIQEKRLARPTKSSANSQKLHFEKHTFDLEANDLEDTDNFTEEDNGYSSEITIDETTQENQFLSQEEILTEIDNTEKVEKEDLFARMQINSEEEDFPPPFEEEEEEEEDMVNEVAAMFGEDMTDDDGADDGGDDDDDGEEEEEIPSFKQIPSQQLQVFPFSMAIFPRVCYLVIDKYSELVTKPLKDFADLGSIPRQEVLQRTLPVFDNHRVAKRFCDRKGKVIKVPDGRILQKTSSFLQAKGINRILINGKIYSLV